MQLMWCIAVTNSHTFRTHCKTWHSCLSAPTTRAHASFLQLQLMTPALYRQGKKKAFWQLMSNDDLPGYEVKVFNSETFESCGGVCYLVKSLFLLCMEAKG